MILKRNNTELEKHQIGTDETIYFKVGDKLENTVSVRIDGNKVIVSTDSFTDCVLNHKSANQFDIEFKELKR